MPKVSLQEQKKIDKLKLKAFMLYKQGYSFRAVGEKLGRSYQWVKLAVDDVAIVDK